MLFDLEESGGAVASTSDNTSGVCEGVGGSMDASIVQQLGAVLGNVGNGKGKSDNELVNVDSLNKTAIQEAARSVQCDAPALVRLRAMHQMCVAKDWAGLTALRKAEDNENVRLLIDSDVSNVEAVIAGIMGGGNIGMLCYVRQGALDRLLHQLFPDKPKRSHKQQLAISRARCGRVTKVRLLELIDAPNDKTSIADPLAGFGSMGDAAIDNFREAMSLLQEIITMESPAQASEAFTFFRTLTSMFKKWLKRGATWAMLSTFYREIADDMEKPAADFVRGAGYGGVLVNLDMAMLKLGTAIYTELEEELADSRGKPTPATKPPSKPPTKPPTAPSAEITPEAWQVCVEALEKDVPKKGGKGPCRRFCIKGVCTKSNCGFHHEGTAGSFKHK
jgi:hypothetical protein